MILRPASADVAAQMNAAASATSLVARFSLSCPHPAASSRQDTRNIRPSFTSTGTCCNDPCASERPCHRNPMRRRLVVYFPLADPAVPAEFVDLYADAGVDIVECGWPARDPYLDGPDVRASMARARSGAPATALLATRERLALKPASPKALVMSYAESDHPALVKRGVFDGIDGVLVVAPPNDARRAAIERGRANRAPRFPCRARSPPSGRRHRRPAGGRLCDVAGRAWAHGTARVARSRKRGADRESARLGVAAPSFSALAFQTARRRAGLSVSAPTAWSSARPRCAPRSPDGLNWRRC